MLVGAMVLSVADIALIYPMLAIVGALAVAAESALRRRRVMQKAQAPVSDA
jgi:hypothetical protein